MPALAVACCAFGKEGPVVQAAGVLETKEVMPGHRQRQ